MEFRVALVDDHALLRGAMAQVLDAAPELPRLQIIQESSLGRLRAELNAGLVVDLVMLELGLPDLGGLLGLASFRNAFPTIPVVVMSDQDDFSLMERCAVLGAAGFVQKTASVRRIRDAVRSVLEGHEWHPGEQAVRSPRDHFPIRNSS